jgi:hypothetical protein
MHRVAPGVILATRLIAAISLPLTASQGAGACGHGSQELAAQQAAAHEEMLASGFVISPRVFSSDGFRRLEERELRLPRDILSEGVPL